MWMRPRGRRHRNNRKSGFRNRRSVAMGVSAFHGVSISDADKGMLGTAVKL